MQHKWGLKPSKPEVLLLFSSQCNLIYITVTVPLHLPFSCIASQWRSQHTSSSSFFLFSSSCQMALTLTTTTPFTCKSRRKNTKIVPRGASFPNQVSFVVKTNLLHQPYFHISLLLSELSFYC